LVKQDAEMDACGEFLKLGNRYLSKGRSTFVVSLSQVSMAPFDKYGSISMNKL
jgi:hypothetical protein